MALAEVWARRSTCPDLAVGCVVATGDGHALSSGYNGAPRGIPHCTKLDDGKCRENWVGRVHLVVHAEANAVAQAARMGISLKGTTAYVTHHPCLKCVMLLGQAGVVRIFWEHVALDEGSRAAVGAVLQQMGVSLTPVGGSHGKF